ncbi:MAG TPA: reactive intermediate/imine deaminase [Flavobacteriales bacterium]|jgi:2-iminobutanoate/2-iminopropanoate deaminase|nr:reactive intermediate/imine deaminase [Flavobacteriales bacterium]
MKEIIYSKEAPEPLGPYSQAVVLGDLIYLSGQVGIDPASGELVKGGVKAQTHQVMHNIAAVLKAANTNFSNVIKTTIFLTSMADLNAVNEIYGGFFEENPPARETVAVSELPAGAHVEISMICSL